MPMPATATASITDRDAPSTADTAVVLVNLGTPDAPNTRNCLPVSYTHLTLPTN